MKKYKNIAIVIIIGLMAWFVSKYYIQFALIKGDSMSPSYCSGKLVLLDKNWDELESGDVIAFKCENVKGTLIKRIVATPGDTVQIKDGDVYVNGINSRNILFDSNKQIEYSGIATERINLDEGEYFVMGDNYGESKDSRYSEIGCVKLEFIIGKVIEHQKH